MVTPGNPITKADMDALATLANTKLSPGTPYGFPAFAGSDQISLPNDMTPKATYGAGVFIAGKKVTAWLYGYKMISGVKTYTYSPLVKAFYPVNANGNFSMTWTWVSPTDATAPDGYVFVVVTDTPKFIWKDIGPVQTLTDDGNFTGWSVDTTLDQNNGGTPTQNLPCGHGAWLKPLNKIHQDLFTGMTLFGGSHTTFDPSFLLSGPWCVSAGQKCYLYLNSTSIYRNLQFWYSEADSATGNQLSPECELLAQALVMTNGANSLNFNANVKINGRIVIISQPSGQSPSDWTLSASHPGITITFDPAYSDGRFPPPPTFPLTGFIFDFVDVQYTVGTPIVLTATPLGADGVYGGICDCVFTGDKVTYTATDATAIHYAGKAAKAAALPNSLAQITLTTSSSGVYAMDCHHRAFCNGVYVANTLPTLGIMPYLDVDLPQYNPQDKLSSLAPSSRRQPISDSNPVSIPHVDNRGALWPIYRDTDFIPDSLFGQPFYGSPAWKAITYNKFILNLVTPDSAPPSGPGFDLEIVNGYFVPLDSADLRIYINNPALTMYIKKDSAPTHTDYDAVAPCAAWFSLASAVPGFTTDAIYYVGVLNPTLTNRGLTAFAVIIEDGTAPNGTFFPTVLAADDSRVPQTEGYSYHFTDTAVDLRPIPLYGYCVYSVTLRRQPVDIGGGILIAPSTGTSDLSVDIGLMQGYGWETQGTFQKIQTVTIPAGQASISASVFLPVLSGTPIAYQCPEQIEAAIGVNFQPMIHSQWSQQTTKIDSADYVIGFYDGLPYYNKDYALLTFVGGDNTKPIVLPVSAVVYNDIQALLNLLP